MGLIEQAVAGAYLDLVRGILNRFFLEFVKTDEGFHFQVRLAIRAILNVPAAQHGFRSHVVFLPSDVGVGGNQEGTPDRARG